MYLCNHLSCIGKKKSLTVLTVRKIRFLRKGTSLILESFSFLFQSYKIRVKSLF